MESHNPSIPLIAAGIVAAMIVLAFVIRHHFKSPYLGGIRVANTKAVKSLPLYRKLLITQRILSGVFAGSLIVAILSTSVLLARPYVTDKVTSGVKKRDIFLCMDASYSLYALNADLTEDLKRVVQGLHGDRFGVCLFNTSNVVYVPMTDDYDYVLQRLDEIHAYFEMQKYYVENYWDMSIGEMTDEQYAEYTELEEKLSYYDTGTLVDNFTRGSSLVGENLASCMYSFPSLGDDDRTRIILLSTDNAQNPLMRQMVELRESASLCKKNKITVFGIFPDVNAFDEKLTESNYDSNLQDLEACISLTGGETYVESPKQTVSQIVDSIQKTEAMTVKQMVQTKATDKPQTAYYVLAVSFLAALISGWLLKR